MKTSKKAIALLLSLVLTVLLTFPAMAAPSQGIPRIVGSDSNISIQPFYTNITATYLSQGATWICADLNAKSKMSLRIDVKVYKNGVLDYSTYTSSSNADYCVLDITYNFISGVTYRIDATYKAGTESVPKSMSFKQR